jgi:hypothetical protein
MLLLTNVTQAASWTYVMQDPNTGANWFIDKSNVGYERGLLCFSAQAVFDNANSNGYKSLIADYEVQSGRPAKARAVAIVFLDGASNIINSAEDPDSDQWYDIPPGTVGYEMMKYAEKYAK